METSTLRPTLPTPNAERAENAMGGATMSDDLRVFETFAAVLSRASEDESKLVEAVFVARKFRANERMTENPEGA